MNKLQITHLAQRGPVESDPEIETPHTLVQLDVRIDDKLFGSTAPSPTDGPVVDAFELLATREFAVRTFLLNCRCGYPDCARIETAVQVQRKDGLIRWVFDTSYRTYLEAQGFDVLAFEFDASEYDRTLNNAERFVVHAEALIGLPAVVGGPAFFSDEGFARQMERVLKNLRRRFPLPQAVRGGNVVSTYPLVPPVSRYGQMPDYEAALPELDGEGHGQRFAVGSIRQHLVYRFHYDQRSQRGSWAPLYLEQNGSLAEAVSTS